MDDSSQRRTCVHVAGTGTTPSWLSVGSEAERLIYVTDGCVWRQPAGAHT